jgi:transcription antitermination factor NusG
MSWFVAIAEHARQQQVVNLLLDFDFLAYAPKFIKTIVKNGRKTEVARFLFGHYFFVKMKNGWEASQFVRGVKRILLNPELHPLLIRDEVIDEIRSREIGGVIRSNEGLKIGQKVTPRVGYLVGMEGRFFRSDRNRDVALFNILGIETHVDFAPGVLEVLEPIRITDQKKKRRRRRRGVGERASLGLAAA